MGSVADGAACVVAAGWAGTSDSPSGIGGAATSGPSPNACSLVITLPKGFAGWTFIGSGLYINLFTVGTSLARSSCSGIQNLYAFIVNTETCIGCGKCAAACRTENHVPPGCYRTWVERYTLLNDGSVEVDSPHGGEQGYKPLDFVRERIQKSFFVPKLCNHCKNPNCVQVCPVGAQSPFGRQRPVTHCGKGCPSLRQSAGTVPHTQSPSWMSWPLQPDGAMQTTCAFSGFPGGT